MKLAKRIYKTISDIEASPIVELGNLRAFHQFSYKADSVGDIPSVESLLNKGYEPSHAMYVWSQNMLSLFIEEATGLYHHEMREFIKIYEESEQEYFPLGPPMSPISQSFFAFWSQLDLCFGKPKQTMSEVFLELLGYFKAQETWPYQTVENLSHSYMGLYRQIGDGKQGTVRLKEFITDREFYCDVPVAYSGEADQIWYVRLVPSLPEDGTHLIINTPYIVNDPSDDWDRYFERNLFRPGKPDLDESYRLLMKYGLNRNYWNEYVFLAFKGFAENAIFLSGVPDDTESLPQKHIARENLY